MPETVKSTLLDVFVNWVEKRLKHKGKKEIENMLLGELPDLRDTQSGKDLIQIGKQEGKIEGKREDILRLLKARFGVVSEEICQKIEQLTSIEKLDELLIQVLNINSVDQLKL